MRALVIANGHITKGHQAALSVGPDDLVIAADGGARVARKLGLWPHLVVGDMDSLPANLRRELDERGCQFIGHPTHKDETDSELAIREALRAGASEIVLVGMIGNRLDHTLANVFLLAMPELAGVSARIWDHRTQVWLVRGSRSLIIEGRPGDIITLLPLGGDASGIETQGLEYALHGDTLRVGLARGVSNVLTEPRAVVSLTSGLLLVVHVTPRVRRSQEGNTPR